MQSEGIALPGKSTGIIRSKDALRNEATNLALKVMRQGRGAGGRILASAKTTGTLLLGAQFE